jgi:hypothetical protein
MPHHEETRGGGRTRASDFVARQADGSENTATPFTLQVSSTVRRLGIAPDHARLVAGIVFQGGGT